MLLDLPEQALPGGDVLTEPVQLVFPPTLDYIEVPEPPLPAWAVRRMPHGCR